MPERESIWRAAFRSVCTTFGIFIGAALALIPICIAFSTLSSPSELPEKSEISIAPNTEGSRAILPDTAPVILKLDIQGIIGTEHITAQQIDDILYDSTQGLLANRIKAILLCINTPGGSAIDSDAIYRSIKQYKSKHQIPVYAFVDGLCASGGMYIACAADKIFATSGSIVGSVGVIFGSAFFNFTEIMKKLGIEAKTISAGKDKDMLNPFRPWTPEEDSSLIAAAQGTYEQFVSIVTNNRPISQENLVNVYGAKIYLAPQAAELGYIDIAGADYASALQELITTASIQDSYQVIALKRPKSILSMLTNCSLNLLTGRIRHEINLGPAFFPEFYGKPLYLYQP